MTMLLVMFGVSLLCMLFVLMPLFAAPRQSQRLSVPLPMDRSDQRTLPLPETRRSVLNRVRDGSSDLPRQPAANSVVPLRGASDQLSARYENDQLWLEADRSISFRGPLRLRGTVLACADRLWIYGNVECEGTHGANGLEIRSDEATIGFVTSESSARLHVTKLNIGTVAAEGLLRIISNRIRATRLKGAPLLLNGDGTSSVVQPADLQPPDPDDGPAPAACTNGVRRIANGSVGPAQRIHDDLIATGSLSVGEGAHCYRVVKVRGDLRIERDAVFHGPLIVEGNLYAAGAVTCVGALIIDGTARFDGPVAIGTPERPASLCARRIRMKDKALVFGELRATRAGGIAIEAPQDTGGLKT